MTPRLFAAALKFVGSAEGAEDAVQDTLMRLWEHRRELRKVGNPAAYAMTLLRHRCLDMIESERRHHPGGTEIGPEAHDPMERIDQGDRLSRVLELIEELPPQQREVITLRDIRGLEVSEIVTATGLSTGNIRVILSRARTAIKSHFKL